MWFRAFVRLLLLKMMLLIWITILLLMSIISIVEMGWGWIYRSGEIIRMGKWLKKNGNPKIGMCLEAKRENGDANETNTNCCDDLVF